MGTCLCKEQSSETDEDSNVGSQNAPTVQSISAQVPAFEYESPTTASSTCATVDRLILETLGIIGSLVENEQEPPPAMLKLHVIADKEDGWIQVVSSMVKVIPMNDPLGPAVITLLLDDCPLPTKNQMEEDIDIVLFLPVLYNYYFGNNNFVTRLLTALYVVGIRPEAVGDVQPFSAELLGGEEKPNPPEEYLRVVGMFGREIGRTNGQRFWVQMQMSRARSPALPESFCEALGLEWGQTQREDELGAT
uniref:Uncharacterized protein n=1 Tax=Timema poppense TaxID=170557 RepID=A0A7R9GYT1_TIMPO|nr:unnamed protein product [Timema poppensis]